MLTLTPRPLPCAIGALFALGLFATTAAAQNSILETFATGAITTGNGTTVVWTDASTGMPAVGWSAGPRPSVPESPLYPLIPPLGNKTWQSGARAIGTGGDSIQVLTVEIGPQGGTLSFDWAELLHSGISEIFRVESQHQLFLHVTSDMTLGNGHVDGVLQPGTNVIQFMVYGTINGPGQAAIDNVRVTGIVPEPASLGLLSLAATCLLRRRRA